MKMSCRMVICPAVVVYLSLSHTAPAESVPADVIDYPALVRAITAVESGGNPLAVGQAGERGLMQLKLETWRDVTRKEFGERLPFARAFEPQLNLQVGQAYLEELGRQLTLNKDKLKGPLLAILVAAYHCGPTTVESSGYSLHRLAPTVRDYVERVLNLHALYRSEYKQVAMVTPAISSPHREGAPRPN